jgi:FAD/FMN-containing dehydrogenase
MFSFGSNLPRASTSGIGRRQFLGATAAVAALLPARRSWADGVSRGPVPSSLSAAGLDGGVVTLTSGDLRDLRSSLGGALLLSHDDGYDAARRLWNGAFDRRPALIARCASTADVRKAVMFARSHSLLTAVKGGGHSLSGQSACDGGLMIDLSPMKGIEIDVAKRTARAQPGVLLAELDLKSLSMGLVTTLGTASDTGIAGLTVGGGQGRLMRRYGLTCDNVRSYELVTAGGEVLQVSASENSDLDWALRGGGGNFGVVTRFEYQMHPFGHPVYAGGRMYPIAQAHTVIGALMELHAKAPDELFLSCDVERVHPGDSLPPGNYVAIEIVYSGERPERGEQVIAPLAKLGRAASDTVALKNYAVAQNGPTGAAPAALPSGLGFYVRSGFLDGFTDSLVSDMVHAIEHGPEWLNAIGGGNLGGAVARVKPEATAYWNRSAQWDVILFGAWSDHAQDGRNAQALRDLWKTFEPHTKGYYVNTEPSAEESRLRATYGGNYARLARIKQKYDPGNLFRLNANIRPAVAG